ncbi:MAG: hypothetical protein HZB26_01125 [Candidatus Hydrogenedentes bacterium]|nr:hypothetical protein [Candidatus Hydrogenedentota bacterium]
MLRSRIAVLGAFGVVAAAFAYGMIRLLIAAYGLGDVYPEYSTYRSDPMGAKALYESLRAVPALSVERNIVPVEKLKNATEASALFVLSGNPWDFLEFTQDELEGVNNVALQGGRVIVTFSPEMLGPYLKGKYSLDRAQRRAERREKNREAGREDKDLDEDDEDDETGAKAEKVESETPQPEKSPADVPPSGDEKDAEGKTDKPGDDADREKSRSERFLPKRVFLPGKWGFRFATTPLPKDGDETTPGLAVRASDDRLPDSVVWRSPLVFDGLTDKWRVIYQRDQRPVIIERRMGAGTIVLCADSYFVSNEAMRYNRYPALLAWLVGPQSRILFDETHNGVVEEPGIVKLARKYRLHGIALAFLVLAVLYIWQSASSLVPPPPEREATESVGAALGKDAASAFVNLLRRSIPPSNLLNICVHEWEKAFARSRPDLTKCLQWMKSVAAEQAALPANKRDLPGTYRTMSHELRKEWKR